MEISADVLARWENYRLANSSKPSARANELNILLATLDPKFGERILEIGTGNGYLTFPIAQAVGEQGLLVTADVVKENLESVVKGNTRSLNIETYLYDSEKIPLFPASMDEYFDAVATIATFHHFDNRNKKTGTTGRQNLLNETYRVLKSGGRLIMSDPVSQTITQRYFDSLDNPLHCYPDGHPHDFPLKSEVVDMVFKAGFKYVTSQIRRVPWKFSTEEEAERFVHTIHNAKCNPNESFNLARELLGFKKVGDHFELGWELFFLQARK